MSKGSAPSAPDPYETASAQYQYGTEAANYNTALNDVNTIGPTGSTQYTITGTDPQTGAPIRSETTSLSPEEQNILNNTQSLQQYETGGLGNIAAENADSAMYQGLPTENGQAISQGVQYAPQSAGGIQSNINTSGVSSIANVGSLEQSAQQQALAGEEAAAQPGMTQAREQLDASLRNAGAQPGTPAYDNAMSALDASQTQQQTQLAGAAITAGTGLENTYYGESANTNQQEFTQAQAQQQAANSAQSQLYGENLQNASFNNQAGQTALADYAQQTGIPLNELQSILGGSQVQYPNSSAAAQGSVSAPDIESAFQSQYAGQLAGYNANVASADTTESTLGSLGVAALLAFN